MINFRNVRYNPLISNLLHFVKPKHLSVVSLQTNLTRFHTCSCRINRYWLRVKLVLQNEKRRIPAVRVEKKSKIGLAKRVTICRKRLSVDFNFHSSNKTSKAENLVEKRQTLRLSGRMSSDFLGASKFHRNVRSLRSTNYSHSLCHLLTSSYSLGDETFTLITVGKDVDWNQFYWNWWVRGGGGPIIRV